MFIIMSFSPKVRAYHRCRYAVVSQLSAPPAALCAATAMHQEGKEQTSRVDEGIVGIHERGGAVTLL